MTRYMLLFSLGPVQSFITQARKTRDLWLGSFLLSALMQASMEGIRSKPVFPYNPIIEKKIPDLPNKYIAIFDTSEEAVDAAENSERNIKTLWQDICNDVWQKVLAEQARFSPVTRVLWDEQTNVENVFEFFWVVVAGEDANYKDWLAETQRMYDRRKQLRDFKQLEETGEKGTISGQHVALRGTGEWRSDVQTFWYQVAKAQSSKDISADGTERLDAIDTVKRFAYRSASFAKHLKVQEIEAGFPSTSSIATAPFMERLITASENPALTASLSTWLNETQKLDETMPAAIPFLAKLAKHYSQGSSILERDGDCFFPTTFSEVRLQKEFRFGEEKRVARERLARSGPESIDKLLGAAKGLTPPITRPTSYYAMIQMDGDKMGRLINGVKDEKEHRGISEALSTFSRTDVPALVEDKYPGRLIYAGGDDAFALAPLARDVVQAGSTQEGVAQTIETVLDLVNQLQQRYRSTVKKQVLEEVRKELVTASTGIAIAHHYTTLSYVRRISKEAEQLAKNQYGRNALVVTVLRRSGEQTRVGCHWEYASLAEKQEMQPIPLFLFFYTLFKEDVLSPKCVYNLLDESLTLIALNTEAQASEIKRILRRQRSSALAQRLPDEEILKKAASLVALAEAMDNAMDKEQEAKGQDTAKSVELHAEGRRYGLVEVLGWLLVMLFLAGKGQE